MLYPTVHRHPTWDASLFSISAFAVSLFLTGQVSSPFSALIYFVKNQLSLLGPSVFKRLRGKRSETSMHSKKQMTLFAISQECSSYLVPWQKTKKQCPDGLLWFVLLSTQAQLRTEESELLSSNLETCSCDQRK